MKMPLQSIPFEYGYSPVFIQVGSTTIALQGHSVLALPLLLGAAWCCSRATQLHVNSLVVTDSFSGGALG